MYYLLGLYLISIASFANAESGDGKFRSETIEAESQQIFTTREQPLGPERTLELLHNLHEYFSGKPESAERAQKLHNLLLRSKIDKTKCTAADFKTFNEYISYYSIYTVNIIPYLKYFKIEQFRECKDQLERNFSTHLSKIDEINIRALHEDVVKANNGLDLVEQAFYIPKRALLKGSLEYFMRQSPQELPMFTANNDGEKLFSSEMLRLFGNLCGRVMNQSNESLETLNTLKFDKDVVAQLRPDIRDWLVCVEICNTIDRMSLQVLSKNLFDEIKVRFPPPSKENFNVRKFLNLFGRL